MIPAERTADYAIFDIVATHADREEEALLSYQRLAEESEDEGFRYLVNLIIEDEIRHHKQISQMVNDVQSFVSELDIRPRVPSLGASQSPEVRRETERLLAFEKEDAKELVQLRKELRKKGGYGVAPLLVDLMLHDTAKHTDILRFILR